MINENLLALNVTDDEMYNKYRQEMTPLLLSVGGEFGYDFKVSETLKSEANHPINRVFTIKFPNKDVMKSFFSSDSYRAVNKKYFRDSVDGVTMISSYDK